MRVGVGHGIAHAVFNARTRSSFCRQANRHAAVIDSPVLPEARQAGRLESLIGIGTGGQQASQGLVVFHQTGGAA